MKKLFVVLSIFVIAAMMLAACQTNTPTAASEEPQAASEPTQVEESAPEEPAEEAAPADEDQTAETEPAAEEEAAVSDLSGVVRVGSWDSADALAPFEEAIASFEAAYPGVDVQLEDVPQGYGDKLLAQFASGTAPDVFQVGDGDVANFASKGVLEPLDEYIAGTKGSDPLDTSIFYPAIADIGKVGGATYLLTKDYSPLVFYYNKNLFDAAGLDYPTEEWTWDDLLNAAEQLTVTDDNGNVTQWGIQIPDGWGDAYWTRGILPIIYQNGGDIISADGTTTTGYMDSPETVAALQWYTDLFLTHKVAITKAAVDATSGADLFQAGQVGMLWTGVWPMGGYITDETMNFGTAPLPAGATRGNSICWSGFAMYSQGENKDAAWAFLRWIGADEGAAAFANYALTAVQSIATEQGKESDPYYGPMMADLANVKPLPDFTTTRFSDCVNTPFMAALEKYFNEGGDLQTIMNETAAESDACLLAD